MEFRIARTARDRYDLEEALFSIDGDALVVDRAGAARLAARIAPGDEGAQERLATELTALGIIHELGHRAVAVERRADPDAGGPVARALDACRGSLGAQSVESGLTAFEIAYPSSVVYRGESSADARRARARDGVDGSEATLEEVMLNWLAARNPAAAPYAELLREPGTAPPDLTRLVSSLVGPVQPDGAGDTEGDAPARDLLARLREPIEASPTSLAGQLRWIRLNWAGWLDDADLLQVDRQLGALDALEGASWLRHRRTPGQADPADHAALSDLTELGDEPEAFSTDRDWMADLVLLAKSTYVWLAQLSRRYGRSITRLDQIPDEELDELAGCGISGLWLIGIWERSHASRRVKQMRGNPDAMASAYSVADYRIADELGGDAAWHDLRERTEARGIRLAADMVPNHMGIDSDWVIEHPERFISTVHPPFESYAFSGEDLSPDARVTIQLEDHYWDSSDAAVVFKRIDRATGDVRYIYHGNDGTSFPWNDTAQLDYLRAEVREAVIEQILEVARRFHVIRFDAAMVLARRHIQRLWYPLPGHEGGIPSRSLAALPADEFARLMPMEFWREVVDRVAAEVPDTLLLAEAFWLMEGFFVRSLGMHRVYNSAFMHMLRDEKNAEYQGVIRETVGFDARILGRYVNFMSNPDERSARDQFGSDDKYFGVATMLATLPGLPMIGHGQIEGYSEQYGMEFRSPRRDETPDEPLVERHRRQIVPLLAQRWRFSGSEGFRQLRAVDMGGEVADVFAYANRADHGPADVEERRSLIVFLNRFPRAHVRVPGVTEALGLTSAPDRWLILRDERSGLDFLRSASDTAALGLELPLDGYACRVFLGFDEVSDADGSGWSGLAGHIGLGGVPDAREALRRLRDEPVRSAVAEVFSTQVAEQALLPTQASPSAGAEVELRGALEVVRDAVSTASVAPLIVVGTIGILRGAAALRPRLVAQSVAVWALFRALLDASREADARDALTAFDEWDAGRAVGELARRAGNGDGQASRIVELTRALLVIEPGELELAASSGWPPPWLAHEAIRTAVGWNRWQDDAFVSREAWDELLQTLAARDSLLDRTDAAEAAAVLRRRAAEADYRVDASPAEGAGGDQPR